MKHLIFILAFITATSSTVYGQTARDTMDRKQTIKNIKLVFDDYVKYQESTDSKADKDVMTNSLKSLNTITDLDELEILINVWMYYDPTDFPSIPEIDRILKNNRPQSIEAVKRRIANRKTWESKESAPYSDLKNLLTRLENDLKKCYKAAEN